MRALIVSDIHSNMEAFSAVIADAQARGSFNEIWSLGDLVGYGPSPSECVELLRAYKHNAVVGNHDLAAVGRLSLEQFNPYAAAANRWTAAQLTREQADYIGEFPMTLELDEFTLAHGSPRNPIWEYLVTVDAAIACFTHIDTYWCLVGHSHTPFLCVPEGTAGAAFLAFPPDRLVQLDSGALIVNPGSVGQPRDGDSRASYAIYDDAAGTIMHHRVAYDIAATQKKMRRNGLPDYLVERLALGL